MSIVIYHDQRESACKKPQEYTQYRREVLAKKLASDSLETHYRIANTANDFWRGIVWG